MQATLAEMDRYNVVLGIVSGPETSIRAWHAAAPGRFIGGAFLGDDGLCVRDRFASAYPNARSGHLSVGFST